MAPNEYSVEAQAIDRRRKLAELMQQQSMTPLEAPPNAGGWAIPISPFAGAAKMLQAYAGGVGQRKADEKMKGLSERRNTALAEALRGMPQGTPGREAITLPDDIQGPVAPAQSAVQPSPQDYAKWMGSLAQVGPDATQIGSTMIGLQDRAAGRAENREFRKDERKARTQDRLEALALQLREGRITREEADKRAAELRRDMQQQSFEQQKNMARLGAQLRPPPQPQPLVQIMGPDGTPVWVERKDAVGRVPAGAGSKAEAQIAGKADVDKDIVTLKSALDQLKGGGGITSTEEGVLPNIGAWAANTGVGQTFGSMGGTTNQKARDVILQARPLLLRSIMQATGMSARSLDSNAELKLWLSTATDPQKGYEANLEALNNIAEKYGSGGFIPKDPSKPITPAVNPPSGQPGAKPRVVDW